MEKKKSPGRKSKYMSHVEPYMKEIRSWRKNGQTEENISKLLGVSFRTFMEYKVKYPQLTQVLKESKMVLISDLENTMFELALGKVKVKKVKTISVKDPRTGKMVIDRTEESEDILPPNPTMIIFSLKNLASDRWQDRRYTDTKVTNMEELVAIAQTLKDIGSKGIDKSQFDPTDDEDSED